MVQAVLRFDYYQPKPDPVRELLAPGPDALRFF